MGLFGKNRGESIIDLREPEGAPAKFEFGFPTRCPECDSPGYLDHIDPFKRIQFEHCPACSSRWEWAEADVDALNVSA